MPATPSFHPGAIWPDDHGVHINAHGGGTLFHAGVPSGVEVAERPAGPYTVVRSVRFTLGVTIPPGTTATVNVPGSRADQVAEGGHAAAVATGVGWLNGRDGAARSGVVAGTYAFGVGR